MLRQTPRKCAPNFRRKDCSEHDMEALLPHKVFPGNKPTNTLLFDSSTRTRWAC